jgi:hypothetical protein
MDAMMINIDDAEIQRKKNQSSHQPQRMAMLVQMAMESDICPAS